MRLTIAVLEAITDHCNWFNYELLEALVNGLGSDKQKADFQAYKDNCLYPYLERAIYKIPPGSIGTQKNDEVALHLKIPDHIPLTGCDLKVLNRKAAYYLKQPSIKLVTYEEGCIELVFSCSLQSAKECASWNTTRKRYEIEFEITSLV